MLLPGDPAARLSWALAALAGLVGAAAFTHSAGYLVTFMTGNTERGVLYFFEGSPGLALSSLALIGAFLVGVVVASTCRRRFWRDHAHGPTVLTTVALATASVLDLALRGWTGDEVDFVPILFVAFAMGALNTSFVKDGEVAVPLSYVTGTLVKLGQGIERHVAGGSVQDWLGYALLYVSFAAGATVGGVISVVVTGPQMLLVAAALSAALTVYTYRHADEQHPETVPLLG